MEIKIDQELIKVKSLDELEISTNPLDGYLIIEDGSPEGKRYPLDNFKSILTSGIHNKPVKITDTPPTQAGNYVLSDVGVYPFGITTEEGYWNIGMFDGTTWRKVAVDADQNITQNITNNTYNLDPQQIVPSEALYTDDTLAGDILKRVDKATGENVNYRETTTWDDGSAMNDNKVDGYVFKKINGKYYKRTFDNLIPTSLIKKTMAEFRAISDTEILLLKIGVYNSVTLKGYYVEFDTPQPIMYYLTDTNETDDGGSVIDVNGNKFKHFFDGIYHIDYFGAQHNGDIFSILNYLRTKDKAEIHFNNKRQYRLSQKVFFNKKITLRGVGLYDNAFTILSSDIFTGNAMFEFTAADSKVINLAFGNQNFRTLYGVVLGDEIVAGIPHNITFENCLFERFLIDVVSKHTCGARFINCTFNLGEQSFYLRNTSNSWKVVGCRWLYYDSTVANRYIFNIESSDGLFIDNAWSEICKIPFMGGIAIDSSNVTIINSWIEHISELELPLIDFSQGYANAVNIVNTTLATGDVPEIIKFNGKQLNLTNLTIVVNSTNLPVINTLNSQVLNITTPIDTNYTDVAGFKADLIEVIGGAVVYRNVNRKSSFFAKNKVPNSDFKINDLSNVTIDGTASNLVRANDSGITDEFSAVFDTGVGSGFLRTTNYVQPQSGQYVCASVFIWANAEINGGIRVSGSDSGKLHSIDIKKFPVEYRFKYKYMGQGLGEYFLFIYATGITGNEKVYVDNIMLFVSPNEIENWDYTNVT